MGLSIRRIGRQGANLSLTLPRELVELLELRRGDDVVLAARGGYLLVRKITRAMRETLECFDPATLPLDAEQTRPTSVPAKRPKGGAS
jgi:antitoxin component of MazEF toxin-antitoxin module